MADTVNYLFANQGSLWLFGLVRFFTSLSTFFSLMSAEVFLGLTSSEEWIKCLAQDSARGETRTVSRL